MAKSQDIGIKPQIGVGVGIGVLVALGFIVLNKISPNFSLGLPSLPMALADYFKVLILCFFAPGVEEPFFRIILLNMFLTRYNMSFAMSNVSQAGIFASYHLLSYGIVLGAISKLSALYGSLLAVSGMFVTAFAFGLLMGLIVHKYQNILPSMIAHSIINGYLYATVFTVAFVIG